MCILACSLVCIEVHVLAIIATRKAVPVPSLQSPAVVLPPMLLQMVSKVALVQRLDPQLPTTVAEGTPCKETTEVPAWPMESGVGGHLLAIVSCFASITYVPL